MGKEIAWGTDNDVHKRSDYFALDDISFYQRIGGEPAIQGISEAVVRKLLLDATLEPVLNKISLQILLDRQKHFFKTAFGAYGDSQAALENLREFYKQQTHPKLNQNQVGTAIGHLKNVLIDLDVPEHEISKLINKLEINSLQTT